MRWLPVHHSHTYFWARALYALLPRDCSSTSNLARQAVNYRGPDYHITNDIPNAEAHATILSRAKLQQLTERAKSCSDAFSNLALGTLSVGPCLRGPCVYECNGVEGLHYW